MFEQEDSDDELMRGNERSPKKMKKHPKPTFKFTKKEKMNKAKDKEKEKDKDDKKEKKEKDKTEKEKDKEKDKREKVEKEQKMKAEEDIRPKWRKKIMLPPSKQPGHDASAVVATALDDVDAKPIFGVSLAVAVERSPCHDGITLPVVVRQCIDYIEEFGLSCEGIYRMSGVKSKVQSLKDEYNGGGEVCLQEHEPNVVASLLKQFLRQLPEPLLTAKLIPKFEQASANKNVKQKVEQFHLLLEELPPYNRLLLSWIIVHMTHVIAKEKENKMSLQNVSIVLSPTLQISHRVLNVLFTYSKLLFKDTVVKRYVPPLKPATSRWTLELPDNPAVIEEELKKQESLLNHLHEELMKVKDPEKEEQLWEVQRVVTHLKRQLKQARQVQENLAEFDQKREEITTDKPGHQSKSITTFPSSEVNRLKDSEERGDRSLSATQEGLSAVKDPAEKSETAAEIVSPMMKETLEEKQREMNESTSPAVVGSKEEESGIAGVKGVAEIAVDAEKHRISCKEQKTKDFETAADKTQTAEKTPRKTKKFERKDVTENKRIEDTSDKKIFGSGDRNFDNQIVDDVLKTVGPETEILDKLGPPADKTTREPVVADIVVEAAGEPAVVDVAAAALRSVQLSTGSGDSSDPYADVPNEDEDDEEEERGETETPEAGTRYVLLDNESPQDLTPQPERLRRTSEDESEMKEPIADHPDQGDDDDQDSFSDTTTSSEPSKFEDNEECHQLEQDLNYLILEEEELLANGNELRQKIAAERNEIERLHQDIAELKQMRQDAFETSSSSSSPSSSSSSSSSLSDSNDELDVDELRELLKQYCKENEALELENASLCDKIHQERQICIAVKVQNRLIQQRLLESSGYGGDLFADQESLL